MNHEIDLKKYEIRTDLVLDVIENSPFAKVDVYEKDNIKVTKVYVDKESSNLIKKREGNYITIEFDDITDSGNRKKVEDIFSLEFNKMIKDINGSILVIGLGNRESTPDSLGPKVIDNVLVTRYLFLLGEKVEDNIREVSAFSPGVMASTGIESVDIISSIVNKIKPALVIVIDSLAASSIERINKSIQITDTGIHPGSGIGNMRKEINNSTLGIPVIAIGVPTVVESSTIVYDTINYLFKHISYIKDNQSINKLIFKRSNYKNKIKNDDLTEEEKKNILGLLGELSDSDKINLISEVLNAFDYNLMVTPKEIDFQIDKLSLLIANGLNKSLHKLDV